MANSTNELLRAALNSGRTPSSGGRSSRRSSRRGTPKSQSRVTSREGSDDEFFDDTASFASDDTWMIEGAEEDSDEQVEKVDNWEDIISAALDALTEKRVATRERALATIVRLMSHKYVGDLLENNQMSYLDSFKRCAKSNKSEKETMLATRALALWFINFGTDVPEEYAETSDLLRTLILNHKSTNVRCLALNTLGVANFISAVDYRDAAHLIKFVDSQFLSSQQQQPVQIIRQALETYGFLMTVVADGDARLAEQLFEEAFSAHMRALGADNVEVRVAAIQNFALVYEALSEKEVSGRYEFDRQEELLATIEMMKRENSKRHGKKDKSMQKSVIRDVLKTIEQGEAPDLKLAFKGRSVHFDDWSRILRLHAFRASLGGGLPIQFVQNPLLHDVFHVEFDASTDDFYKHEARVVVDSNSELAKFRSQDMRRRRDMRGAARRFNDDDGY
ncbi:Interferon- developmental regulator 1 [Dipsacomyces acuminosporus]|nr:Interferon- developmental regulator 1 [Dipsacomyces acuminosporus]